MMYFYIINRNKDTFFPNFLIILLTINVSGLLQSKLKHGSESKAMKKNFINTINTTDNLWS